MIALLISLLVLGGIGALLALFLEVADSYIADYGEQHIIINDQKDLLVEGGNSLLFTLMDNGIFIPSACGGRGTCGYCKVKVLEGGGQVLPTETPYLNAKELAEGVRLSCQCKVRETVKIEIPEELFNVREYRVKVAHIEKLTPEIKGVRFDILEPEEGIRFKAGQYIQLMAPEYELCSDAVYRAYSISSSAKGDSGENGNKTLELVITKVPEGVCSTFIHDYLKEGDELTIIGPHGDFYLRDSDRGILLIATGSGLAPIRSILYQIRDEKIERKTTVFFGARTKADLFYYDELKGFDESLENVTFIPTLSRPAEEDRWEGEQGRVTDLIERYVEDANLDVYICGSPNMVAACEEALTKKGIPKEHIYYDKFG